MSSKAIDLEGWDIAKPRPYGYLCNLRMCSDCRCDGTNHIQNEIFETPEFAYAAANVQFSQRNLGVSKSNFKEQRKKRKLQMSRCDEETGRANDELAAQQILEQDGIDPDEITATIRLIMHSLSPSFREIAFYSFSGLSSAEIAERLDTGIDVVCAQINRLKNTIKSILETSGIRLAALERIANAISFPTQSLNDLAAFEMTPWPGGNRFNWREYARYIHSRESMHPLISDVLKRARKHSDIIERDQGDIEYIIDQIGLLTIEVQRSNPNVALLLKCIDRIGEISPVIAKILEPISCGRLKAAAVT